MRWAEATEERALMIARDLREDDRQEVWLSHRATPTEAMLESWGQSDLCRCIVTDDGEPVGMTGGDVCSCA